MTLLAAWYIVTNAIDPGANSYPPSSGGYVTRDSMGASPDISFNNGGAVTLKFDTKTKEISAPVSKGDSVTGSITLLPAGLITALEAGGTVGSTIKLQSFKSVFKYSVPPSSVGPLPDLTPIKVVAGEGAFTISFTDANGGSAFQVTSITGGNGTLASQTIDTDGATNDDIKIYGALPGNLAPVVALKLSSGVSYKTEITGFEVSVTPSGTGVSTTAQTVSLDANGDGTLGSLTLDGDGSTNDTITVTGGTTVALSLSDAGITDGGGEVTAVTKVLVKIKYASYSGGTAFTTFPVTTDGTVDIAFVAPSADCYGIFAYSTEYYPFNVNDGKSKPWIIRRGINNSKEVIGESRGGGIQFMVGKPDSNSSGPILDLDPSNW
jgi:hypothetical protein